MCGRYLLTRDAEALAAMFDAEVGVALTERYNIAPTQPVPVVRVDRDTHARQLNMVHWGLVPAWADDPKIGNRLINARAETVDSRPAFRAAFRYRRCLVPADGFYEWERLPDGRKQPHLVRLADEDEPLAFAGLWEHWQDPTGNELESCTILTTAANEMMARLHTRMPAILEPADYTAWLDPANQQPGRLKPLLRPYPAERMTHYPVSTYVNSARHEDARCIEPMGGGLF